MPIRTANGDFCRDRRLVRRKAKNRDSLTARTSVAVPKIPHHSATSHGPPQPAPVPTPQPLPRVSPPHSSLDRSSQRLNVPTCKRSNVPMSPATVQPRNSTVQCKFLASPLTLVVI